MKRRPLLAGALATLAGSGRVRAQTPASKVWRIGVLSLSVPPEPAMIGWIAQVLAPYGYELGRNLVIDYKFALHNVQALPKLAVELIDAKPDLLIGLFTIDGLALKRATTTIPIVMMYATTPIELGLVKSLARPGGNITGTVSASPDLWAKTFQVLREVIPQTRHVVMIFDPEFLGMNHYLKQAEVAARLLGIRLGPLPVRTAGEIDSALPGLLRDRPNAVNVAMVGVLNQHVRKVMNFAADHKLPVTYSIQFPVLYGGLMSYAPDFGPMRERNAWQIDRIFKGAKPSDLPVEEPAKFQLTINMKTARAMGLVIPQIVLLQATELIE